MAEGKNNEENDWENEARLHGCMSSFHSSRFLVPRPCSLPSGTIVAKTLECQTMKSVVP